MHLFTTWPQIAANGAAKIPFKKLLVEIAGARLATEISVQFAFNSFGCAPESERKLA
jgi:hypothetical protein